MRATVAAGRAFFSRARFLHPAAADMRLLVLALSLSPEASPLERHSAWAEAMELAHLLALQKGDRVETHLYEREMQVRQSLRVLFLPCGEDGTAQWLDEVSGTTRANIFRITRDEGRIAPSFPGVSSHPKRQTKRE